MKPIKPLKRTITNTNGLKYLMRRLESKRGKMGKRGKLGNWEDRKLGKREKMGRWGKKVTQL